LDTIEEIRNRIGMAKKIFEEKNYSVLNLELNNRIIK